MDVEPQDEDIVDLREDPLSYPVQCTDVDQHNDFIDLALDRFPVQCTEPSEPNMNIPHCTRTLTDCLDILLREFHAHVCSQHQQ